MFHQSLKDALVLGRAILRDSKAVFEESLLPNERGRYEIGECRKVRIKCVSEMGFRSNGENTKTKNLQREHDKKGSPSGSDSFYAAGSCALIEIETLEGFQHSFLFGCGGDEKNMNECLQREGIDDMLVAGDLGAVVISHAHRDHFWGLGAVLKYNSKVSVYIPNAFDPRSVYCFVQNELIEALGLEWLKHDGALVKLKPGGVVKLFEGCAALTFECAPLSHINNETSLCFRVKDIGLVLVCGCCHQGMSKFAGFAKESIEGGERIYGFYGGLHIAPYGRISSEGQSLIDDLTKYGFERIGCNHCTGAVAIERMLQMGYPIVKGSGKLGSKKDLYLGSRDEVVFGLNS